MPSLDAEPGSAGAALTPLGADFTSVLEAVPDAMVGLDRAGVIRFVNRQTEAMFGYDRDFLVGRLIETLVPESFRTVHQARREGFAVDPQTREMGSLSELIGRKRDGTEFPVDIGLAHTGTGENLLLIAAVRDMTARHKLEADRRQADRMSAVVEFSPDAIIGATLEGIITSWNQGAERLYGYSSKETIGRSSKLLFPEVRVVGLKDVMARIKEGQDPENVEGNITRRDGTVVLVSVRLAPIRDEDGAVVAMSSVHRDVTQQRQAFETAQRMAAIVEDSGDAIIIKTLDGIIMSWNPAAEQMYGYRYEEIVGKSIEILSQ